MDRATQYAADQLDLKGVPGIDTLSSNSTSCGALGVEEVTEGELIRCCLEFHCFDDYIK